MSRSVVQQVYTHVFKPYGILPVAFRRATSHLRPIPDFLIIGAQKSGTTTLHGWISNHPEVKTGVWKEVHFFDWRHRYEKRGLRWYRSHFPVLIKPSKFKVGESTPEYLFNPASPRRVAETIPNARLVVLLRNPVDRAYSHYHHSRRLGAESLTFKEALEAEEDRIKGEMRKLKKTGTHKGKKYMKYSYKKRGEYADQIERWLKYFDRSQFLFIKSESMFRKPKKKLKEVKNHIGVSNINITYKDKKNEGNYEKMEFEARKKLRKHFEVKNKKLEKLIGKKMRWE
nr:sulfotransferase domain-containing protein [Salinibacter ruber]